MSSDNERARASGNANGPNARDLAEIEEWVFLILMWMLLVIAGYALAQTLLGLPA